LKINLKELLELSGKKALLLSSRPHKRRGFLREQSRKRGGEKRGEKQIIMLRGCVIFANLKTKLKQEGPVGLTKKKAVERAGEGRRGGEERLRMGRSKKKKSHEL